MAASGPIRRLHENVSRTGAVSDGDWSPRIAIGTAVMIPEGFVPDPKLRLALHRRLTDLDTPEEIDAFADGLIDRFGPLPQEVEHLLKIVFIKGPVPQGQCRKLDAGPEHDPEEVQTFRARSCGKTERVVIHFRKREFSDPAGLVPPSANPPANIRPDQSVVFTRDWPKKRLAGSAVVMTQLARLATKAG